MSKSVLLFHWAPTSRRKAIIRRGLVPGSWSTDRLWRPPFVCFSDSPSLAWALSGDTARGHEIDGWDLWQTWRSGGYEVIPFDTGNGKPEGIKEYRVYERVFKRDLWYVASRTRLILHPGRPVSPPSR